MRDLACTRRPGLSAAQTQEKEETEEGETEESEEWEEARQLEMEMGRQWGGHLRLILRAWYW
jgi:hypothetical protein